MTKLILSAICLFTSACASTMKVSRISQEPIDPKSRELVLLNGTRWDNALRLALVKKHFVVKKFASTGVVRETTKDSDHETAVTTNQAEARYALSLNGYQKDECIFGDAVKINASIEVSDLKTNEVVAVLEKTGWTGNCHIGSITLIFDEFADAIEKLWDSPEQRVPASE